MRFSRFIKDKQNVEHGSRPFKITKEHKPILNNPRKSNRVIILKNKEYRSVSRIKANPTATIIPNRKYLHIHNRQYFPIISQYGLDNEYIKVRLKSKTCTCVIILDSDEGQAYAV